MKIFIDTNILLDFYRSSQDKVDILKDLKLYKDSIIFPEQVYNEFKRNRINVLQSNIESLNKTLQFPPILNIPVVRERDEYKELKNLQNLFKEKKERLISLLQGMIDDSTKDIVSKEIDNLFNSDIQIIYNNDDILKKARRRQLLGNPPKAYKKTDALSACDEIIWEALLSSVREDLVIVSRDNTYKYNYDFLSKEYSKVTSKELKTITTSIKDAFHIIGKTVSPKFEKLEEEQIEEVITNDYESIQFPVIIDNISYGYAPFSMQNKFGNENIRFCYNCRSHTRFSGVRCTQCGAYNDD